VTHATIIGDIERFGFGISPIEDSPSGQVQVVDIYVASKRLAAFDNSAYIPSFATSLERTSDCLKAKIDYLRFVGLFGDKDPMDIHALLRDDETGVEESHRFMEWGETTNDIISFLIPYRGQLHLTYQMIDYSKTGVKRLSQVDGLIVTPYELIVTLDQMAQTLQASWHPANAKE
jgi:hypothetical protein